ncbi:MULTISPECIES: hypothetical protein [Hahella]|uniref:Uncharacterized protein n=1 Tax=Hahella chejuensis (strain KCTC 2396) TaxID=349521 RepID=Q2SEA4_HAHCH|nr:MULTISPECIES: hypothetical protein [Hahella]ABC31020.1 conserved hypothetical protein [Hahella chejuensis KCTC 2396]MBU6954966.1 transcriptional regulator [Hahella sp. HN01]MDG9668078.1 transcriptional regulator [Hahella sp. CR1]WLQ17170.1 transcriptional regulator [Hahella sp. HNIBRBA332]
MSVTKRIERLLLDRGVHPRKIKREISVACNVRYETVRQWFNGDIYQVGADYLITIADKWDGNFEWLRTGDGPMYRVRMEEDGPVYQLPPEKQAWLDLYDRTTEFERTLLVSELDRIRHAFRKPSGPSVKRGHNGAAVRIQESPVAS